MSVPPSLAVPVQDPSPPTKDIGVPPLSGPGVVLLDSFERKNWGIGEIRLQSVIVRLYGEVDAGSNRVREGSASGIVSGVIDGSDNCFWDNIGSGPRVRSSTSIGNMVLPSLSSRRTD